MTFNIHTFLQTRPLSASALSSFKWDPQQWYERYILEIKTPPNAAMLFGSKVGKQIEKDPTYLPHIPRLSKMEYEWKVAYGKISCVGFADSFCTETCEKLCEYKTGKLWNQKKVDEHDQITFYCLLNYLKNEVKPEDMDIRLAWMPTQEKDGKVSFIEPIEKTTKIFKAKRTMVDILNFGIYVNETVKKMQEYVDSRQAAPGKALKGSVEKLKNHNNKQMLTNKERQDQKGKFISVLADGKMHLNVPEGTEGAIKREYETSDGKKGSKTELVFTELSGIISGLKFWEGDYGVSLQVTVLDGEEEPVILSLNATQTFGEDFMKKLPNINLKKPVTISPYSFEDDKEKKRRGVTVYQEDEKVENFYYDKDKKKNANGYPSPAKKYTKKSEWKKYFQEANEFLIGDITKRFKLENEESEEAKNF